MFYFFPSPGGMKKPEIPFGLTQLLGLFQDKTLHFLKYLFEKRLINFSQYRMIIFFSFPFFVSLSRRSSGHVVVA